MSDLLRKNSANQTAQDKPGRSGDPMQPPTEEEKKKPAQSKGDAGKDGGQPKATTARAPRTVARRRTARKATRVTIRWG